jgi:hypothetical protein
MEQGQEATIGSFFGDLLQKLSTRGTEPIENRWDPDENRAVFPGHNFDGQCPTQKRGTLAHAIQTDPSVLICTPIISQNRSRCNTWFIVIQTEGCPCHWQGSHSTVRGHAPMSSRPQGKDSPRASVTHVTCSNT